jgi:hypothetical protein
MLPKSADLHGALLEVLRANPDGLQSKVIDDQVQRLLQISEEDMKIMRNANRSEFAYRLAWERTHAKNRGLIIRLPGNVWKIVNDQKTND